MGASRPGARASDKLNGYVTFPLAAQVACVEREIFHLRLQKRALERTYLITSPNRTQASLVQLLAQNRGHSSRTACTLCATWPMTRIVAGRA